MDEVAGHQDDHFAQYAFNNAYTYAWGTRWLCDIIGKVSGSIPDGVIGIFH